MPHPPSEERRLVRRLLAGDEEAFARFFTEYFPRLYRFALVRLDGDQEEAKEVIQVTMCKLLEQLVGYGARAPLFTWLCSICRNEIVDRRRRRQRSPEVELLEEAPRVRRALEALAGSSADDPESSLLAREAARLVHATLDHLPPRYAAVLELRYLEGWGVAAIAAHLGLSYKATESTLTRARSAFEQGMAAVAGGDAR